MNNVFDPSLSQMYMERELSHMAPDLSWIYIANIDLFVKTCGDWKDSSK